MFGGCSLGFGWDGFGSKFWYSGHVCPLLLSLSLGVEATRLQSWTPDGTSQRLLCVQEFQLRVDLLHVCLLGIPTWVLMAVD